MADQKEKSQEEMVREAVEEAKRAAEEDQPRDEADAGEEGAGETDTEAEETEETEESEGAENAGDESEDAEAGTDDSETENNKSGKKLFGRKPKKDKKDEKIDELTDQLTRQMAEFDNYRKRTDKEKSQMYEIGAKDIIEKILPVIDNFERGLEGVKEENKEDPFVQGMDMTYRQLMSTLEGIGVTPIEAIGQEFNPDLHNAVMHVDDDQFGENVVVEEFQKGYMYRDTVVRHSMVKVAN